MVRGVGLVCARMVGGRFGGRRIVQLFWTRRGRLVRTMRCRAG